MIYLLGLAPLDRFCTFEAFNDRVGNLLGMASGRINFYLRELSSAGYVRISEQLRLSDPVWIVDFELTDRGRVAAELIRTTLTHGSPR